MIQNNKRISLKKVILLLFALILSICSITGILIKSESNKIVDYRIQITGNKNEEALGDEVRIVNIKIDGNNIEFSNMNLPDGFKYVDDQIVGYYSGESSYMEIEVKKSSELEITFLKHPWSGIVEVSYENDVMRSDLFSNNTDSYIYSNYNSIGIFNLLTDYLIDINIKTIICMIIALLTIMFAFYGILLYVFGFVKKLVNNDIKLIDIVLFSLSILIIYFNTIYLSLSVYKFIPVIVLILLLGYILYKYNENIVKNIQNIFILIALIIGTAFIFILPPFHVPDEATHFVNSYYKSFLGNEFIKSTESNGKIYLPKGLDEFMEKYYTSVHEPEYKIDAITYFDDFNGQLDEKDIVDEEFDFANTKNLNALPYIPSIIVIALGRMIKMPISIIFYLSRFINLMIWTILGYYALKKIPYFKNILFLVMLLPISIHQAIGINQDWLTNGCFFLLFAMILNSVYGQAKGKIVCKKELVSILFVSICLSFCKTVYFPIILLVLLIPKERFINRKQEILIKVLLIIPSISISIWQIAFSAMTLTTDARDGFSIAYSISHPYETIKIYIDTVFQRLPLDLLDGLNTGFGWSTKWGNTLTRFVCNTICILLITSNKEDNIKFTLKDRVVFIIVSAIMIGIVYTSMYLGWSRLGTKVIDGLQPRYFIPIAALLYITCTNNKIFINMKSKNFVYSSSMFIILGLALYTLVNVYYI